MAWIWYPVQYQESQKHDPTSQHIPLLLLWGSIPSHRCISQFQASSPLPSCEYRYPPILLVKLQSQMSHWLGPQSGGQIPHYAEISSSQMPVKPSPLTLRIMPRGESLHFELTDTSDTSDHQLILFFFLYFPSLIVPQRIPINAVGFVVQFSFCLRARIQFVSLRARRHLFVCVSVLYICSCV